MKKKVLFTSHVANFAKFNYPFMQWLKKQGYEVHYASMGEEPIDCDRHFTIPFARSPFKLNNLRAIKQLKKIIDSEGYDIIHTHTPMGSVVTRLAAKDARKNGTRVIYTAHGFHFFTGAPLLNWLIYYPIEKVMAKYTDTLITINKEDYERAKANFDTDVQYVPGVGIDPKKFNIRMSKSEKRKLRESLGLTDDSFVMIYTAELSRRKGQLWLINTLSSVMLENEKIHLLLPGKDSLNGECQLLVARYNLEDRVHFLGYRKDIGCLLRVSDLALSASKQEGLPVNILEAMYVGLPIVATACRGNSDLLASTNNKIVVNNDGDTFAKYVSEIYRQNGGKIKSSAQIGEQLIKPYLLDSVLLVMQKIYDIRNQN